MKNKNRSMAMSRSGVSQMGQQRGVTLIISLILLLVMSMLGLSSIKVTTMEEKMVSNTQDMNIAFEAAEAALRIAATDITNAEATGFTDNCASGYCTAAEGDDAAARWEDTTLAVWYTNGKSQVASGVVGVASQPEYIIEKMSFTGTSSSPSRVVGYGGGGGTTENYYRVTARGTGGTDTAVVVLQALYVQ